MREFIVRGLSQSSCEIIKSHLDGKTDYNIEISTITVDGGVGLIIRTMRSHVRLKEFKSDFISLVLSELSQLLRSQWQEDS